MNVLRGGRPVAYCEDLDGLTFDYNGFVESGLACRVQKWSSSLYRELRLFYSTPAWRAVMRSYDASYEGDKEALEYSAADKIMRHLS